MADAGAGDGPGDGSELSPPTIATILNPSNLSQSLGRCVCDIRRGQCLYDGCVSDERGGHTAAAYYGCSGHIGHVRHARFIGDTSLPAVVCKWMGICDEL